MTTMFPNDFSPSFSRTPEEKKAKNPFFLHGTALVMNGMGVVFYGPSGAGKSDFALRCLAHFGEKRSCLVGDDQVRVESKLEGIWMESSPRLWGFLEVRGVGIVSVRACEGAFLSLVVALGAEDGLERLPSPLLKTFSLLGKTIPMVSLDPSRPSACLKMGIILDLLQERRHMYSEMV